MVEHQVDFIRCKSRTKPDIPFQKNNLTHKYLEYNKEFLVVGYLSISTKKNYDSVIRNKLWLQLGKFGIPRKLVQMSATAE